MRRLAFAVFALLFTCGGKSTEILVPAAQLRQKASCVAIIGFANTTKTNGASEAFSEQLATGLRSAGFQVMDRSETQRMFGFHRMYVLDVASDEEAAALGDLLGVQAVVFGTVHQYEVARSDNAGLEAAVDVEIKLVDVETAKLLMRARVDGDGRRSFGPRPAPLFAAAEDASNQLVRDLTKALGNRNPSGNEPCWRQQAETVLATLGGATPKPTPTTTESATPEPTPTPVALSAPQKSLLLKLAAGGQFALEGVGFTGMTEQLASASSAPLSDLAAVLKAYPDTRIEIVGYVDALDKDPIALSSSRAEAVAAKLASLGVNGAQVVPKGKGGSDPRMPSFTEITRAKNRRIEISVSTPPVVKDAPSKPRVKIVAAPGGQLNALQLHAKLKGDDELELAKKVTQTRTQRPTTIYYRPGQREIAARIAKAMTSKPRARQSTKIPSGVDVYVLVGPPGETP